MREHAAVIADAAACGAVSWDSESRAGEMLQPAGYRPAGAWVRAGAGLRGAGGSVGMSCVRFALVLRFWRGVSCSSCACHTFLLECLLRLIYAFRAALSECLMFDHACCLPHGAKQNGLREAAFLFRRGARSPVVRSQWPCGYRAWRVHFGLARFFVAIPTEDEGTRKRGTESAARCGRVFAWTYWLCNVFRGSTLGQKVEAAQQPPQTAPRRQVSLDSLHLIRDVGAFHAARGARVQRRLDRLQ